MSSVIARLRKTHPYLTPPFIGEDDEQSPLRLLRSSRQEGRYPDEPIAPIAATSPPLDSPPVMQSPPDTTIARPRPQMEQMLAPPDVPDLSADDYRNRPPAESWYQGDRRSRPMLDSTISDPQAQTEAYRRDVGAFQPQRISKKRVVLDTAMGFLFGGIPGAARTAYGEISDRRGPDRNWQQSELGRTDQTISRLKAEKIAQQREDTNAAMSQMQPIYGSNGEYLGSVPAKNAVNARLSVSRGQEKADTDRKNSLLREMNGVRDFDPADPANAGYVKRYTDEFGSAPMKRVSGSLYVLDKGTGPDGRAVYNVIQKDTGTAAEVTGGNLPEKTEPQLNREQGEKNLLTREQRQDDRARLARQAARENLLINTRAASARLGNPDDYSKIADDATADADVARKKAEAFSANSPAARQYRQEALAHDKQAAQARMAATKARSGQSGGSGKYAGQTISRSKLPEAAKRLNMTPAEAEKYITNEGGAIRQ